MSISAVHYTNVGHAFKISGESYVAKGAIGRARADLADLQLRIANFIEAHQTSLTSVANDSQIDFQIRSVTDSLEGITQKLKEFRTEKYKTGSLYQRLKAAVGKRKRETTTSLIRDAASLRKSLNEMTSAYLGCIGKAAYRAAVSASKQEIFNPARHVSVPQSQSVVVPQEEIPLSPVSTQGDNAPHVDPNAAATADFDALMNRFAY